jgi:hypothetical protein
MKAIGKRVQAEIFVEQIFAFSFTPLSFLALIGMIVVVSLK